MGLELDTLKQKEVCVVYDNTTGRMAEFYGGDDFIEILLTYFKIKSEDILKYFTKYEIKEFFIEYDMDLEKLEEAL